MIDLANKPKVSIILPFYNRAWSLERSVQSVIKQSFKDWELILVDDGSTDLGSELAQKFAQSDPRIQYFRTENHGVSAARNFGVLQSQAEVITFLDSDDEWKKSKLEKHLIFHTENGFEISQTKEVWIREGVRVNAPKHLQKQGGDIYKISLLNCMITPSSVMMNRSLWDTFSGFDESLPACEDYDLWLQISHRYLVGLLDEELLIRYGGHEDQLSAKYYAMDRFRLQALLKVLDSPFLSEEQKEQTLKVARKKHKVLYKGAQKRDNQEVIQFCEKISSNLTLN